MGFIGPLIAIFAFIMPATESYYPIDNVAFWKDSFANNQWKSQNGISVRPNPSSQDITSAVQAYSVAKNGEAWGLEANFNSQIAGSWSFLVDYWVKFSSTLSDKIFQFGQDSEPHYIFSSKTTNGFIKGAFYKDATTTDSANDFYFKIPLSNCYTDNFILIAFHWSDWGEDASTSVVRLDVLISGVGFAIKSYAGPTSAFQLPTGYMLFGLSVYKIPFSWYFPLRRI